jgi:hypothetical protein
MQCQRGDHPLGHRASKHNGASGDGAALSTLGFAHSHVHALRVPLENLSKYKEEWYKEEWPHPAFLIVRLKNFRSWTTQQPPSDRETS